MNSLYTEHTVEISSFDGYIINCRVYEPLGQKKADILCLHGIQSHSGWYGKSSRYLAGAGYRVIFPDRRGCGMNKEKRGSLNYWQDLLFDIEYILKHFSCPMRIHLLAISWGAKLATMIAYSNYPWLDKLILITPGIIAQVGFNLIGKLKIAGNFLFHGGNSFFPIPIAQASYFTNDKQYQEYIEHDNLMLRQATARFFVHNNIIDTKLAKLKTTCTVPAFMLLARDDRIIDNTRTQRLFTNHFIHPKSMFKYYCDCAHTLEFDIPCLSFVDDIISFLE
jgi:alpha-beta hydrolase superfamily lysophospholipase